MARPKKGERILGPYFDDERERWRVVTVAADGSTERPTFGSEKEAREYIDLLLGEISANTHSTESAIELYRKYLEHDKGNKPGSIYQTTWALKRFFPEPLPLRSLKPATCAELYDKLAAKDSPTKIAVDTHRNTLSQVKTFLKWCKARKFISTNPAAEIEGKGRRSKGKPQLAIKEARLWYLKALELALAGRQGAAGALIALLLGLRASEIVAIKVEDLDDDEAPCDRLRIPDSKTLAGRRTLEVPEELRPVFVALAKGKARGEFLFKSKRSEQGRRGRAWPRKNIQRICRMVGVPTVSAHAMRGLMATIAAERGLAGHVVAATLGHEDERTTRESYARLGAFEAGARKRGVAKLRRA